MGKIDFMDTGPSSNKAVYSLRQIANSKNASTDIRSVAESKSQKVGGVDRERNLVGKSRRYSWHESEGMK
jgi:hypothetical protein